MTCLGQVGQQYAQVHRQDLLESGAPDEAERVVLFSAISAESWCFWGLFSWDELGWLLTGGHRHLMIEYLWSLVMRRFAVTRFKILQVKYKIRGILLTFIEE